MKRATKPWTVIILVVLLLLTACQPTPKADVVVNKGEQGRIEEAPEGRYEAPGQSCRSM